MVVALSEADAASKLRRQGLTPLSIDTSKQISLIEMLGSDVVVSDVRMRRQTQLFSEDVGVLVEAGLPVSDAFRQLLPGLKDKSMRRHVETALSRLEGGENVAVALENSKYFPQLLIALVKAGEKRGRLAESFTRYAQMEESALKLRDETLSATVYPAFLFLATLVAMAILFVWVVPVFKTVFEQSGASLPLSTQILTSIGDFIQLYAWWILAAIVALPFLGILFSTVPALRPYRDGAILKVPFLGSLLAGLQRSRFMQTTGALIQSGVAPPESLMISAEMLGNYVLRQQARDMAPKLREGGRFAELLVVPPLGTAGAAQFAAIGEQSGRLGEMLVRSGLVEESAAKRKLSSFLAALGPFLTLFIGVVIGGVAYSILSAVLGAYDLG